MKQNRKFFSLPLFWEGVRQTRLFGILFAVILALQILLVIGLPTITYLTEEGLDLSRFEAEVVGGLSVAPALIASYCLAAPILTLTLFRFLNQRASADFYHAVPYTRPCLYLSLMGSVGFWLLLYGALAAVLGVALCALCSQFFTLLVGQYLIYVLACTVSAFAVAAGISLAMTLTGTTFTNLVMSAMILFLPRLLILCVSLAVTDALPILATGQLHPLLSADINLITGTVFSALLSGMFSSGVLESFEGVIHSTESILYTAVLALVYLALATCLFLHRKSETAQRSAPTRRMQALYRILLTFSYFAVFVALLFSNLLYREVEWQVVFLIILFGVLLYALYELFTTKSFKKVLRALPGLGIVALGVCVYFGLLWGMTRLELRYAPTAESIHSVTLLNDADQSSRYLEFSNYVDLNSPEVELTDPALVKLVAENLAEETRILREEGYEGWTDHYTGRGIIHYTYDGYVSTDSIYSSTSSTVYYESVDFRIRSEEGTKVRRILLTREELSELTRAMERDEAYKSLWMTLPESIGSIDLNGRYLPYNGVTDEERQAVLTRAREELKNADFDTWYQYNKNFEYDFSLTYTIADGPAQGKHLYVNLSEDCFPETLKFCYELESKALRSRAEEFTKLVTDYEQASDDEKSEWYIHASISLPAESDSLKTSEAISLHAENIEAVKYLLEHLRETPRDSSGDLPTAYLCLERPDGDIQYHDVAGSSVSMSYAVVGLSENFILEEGFDAQAFLPYTLRAS